MGMVSDTAKLFADSMLLQKEKLLRSAISCKIGRSDWSIEEMKGRLRYIVWPDKSETYLLDEAPLMRFLPFELEVGEDNKPCVSVKYEAFG
ncbi:MAG: hypothetical protein OEX19_04020 [Gammaproteobacteria bacterium]|nr:hypothetical protein [Gammaproteobacteria bacterium]